MEEPVKTGISVMRLSQSDDVIVARLFRETSGIPETKGMTLVVVPFLFPEFAILRRVMKSQGQHLPEWKWMR